MVHVFKDSATVSEELMLTGKAFSTTVEPLLKDTPEIRTPLYSGHFAVTQINPHCYTVEPLYCGHLGLCFLNRNFPRTPLYIGHPTRSPRYPQQRGSTV